MANYSKKELEAQTKNEKFGSERHKEIITDLVGRAHKNEKMSAAEADFVCRFMELSTSENPQDDFDVNKFEICNDYVFKSLYLTYYNNLNGVKSARNFMGSISIEQKQRDIKKLDEIHESWYPKLRKFNHKDALLNIVASEFKEELKSIEKQYDVSDSGYNLYKAKVKAISLHSKYVYLTVKAFFEENGDSTIIQLNEKEIHLDMKSLTHILRGHYAGATKQLDTGKSFHSDMSIKHLNLPNHLKEILETIDASEKLSKNQLDHLPFRYNGVVYSIWTKRVVTYKTGVGQTEFIRLQTFYPVTETEELDKLANNYAEQKVDEKTSVFVKNAM